MGVKVGEWKLGGGSWELRVENGGLRVEVEGLWTDGRPGGVRSINEWKYGMNICATIINSGWTADEEKDMYCVYVCTHDVCMYVLIIYIADQ